MSDWIEVARIDDFPIGACRVVHANGVRIAVFRLESGFYAIEDVCSHDGGELASGTLNGREITCPAMAPASTSPPARSPRRQPTKRLPCCP